MQVKPEQIEKLIQQAAQKFITLNPWAFGLACARLSATSPRLMATARWPFPGTATTPKSLLRCSGGM